MAKISWTSYNTPTIPELIGPDEYFIYKHLSNAEYDCFVDREIKLSWSGFWEQHKILIIVTVISDLPSSPVDLAGLRERARIRVDGFEKMMWKNHLI